jgi:hypothetical protein
MAETFKFKKKITIFIMPSRKDTLQFIKDNDLNLKGYSKLNVTDLNNRVESVVDGEVKKRWNRLKIKTEATPMTREKTAKLVRREQLKQGTPKKVQATTIEGEIANLLATSDRLEAEKKKKRDSEKTRIFKAGIEREKRERAKRDEERRKEAEEIQKRIEARKKFDELQKKKQKKKKKKKKTDYNK